jgi:hypothetical protein
MAEAFKMNQEYRGSDEYKEWVRLIQRDAPHLPIGMIEYAIIAHKTQPDAYKKDKQAKKLMSEPIKQPKNAGEIVVNDAIAIGDATDDILKQREAFFKEHNITEEAEFIPKSLPAIEEVEAS